MPSLRILPNLRSSVVEEKPADQVLLFTSRLGDSDAALSTSPTVLPFTWPRLLRAIARPDLELLEVAEPLWLAEWVRALRYVVLLKVLRRLLPGRSRVAVATYAIENLDVRERLSFPSLDSRPRLGAAATAAVTRAVGVSLLTLDLVAFGTTGASENYRRAFGWALRRTTHAVLPPQLGPCRVCGPDAARATHRDPTVLFLGAPSERKGFPVLLSAWVASAAAEGGWSLLVADPDGAGAPELPPGVAVRSPTREAVHEMLRAAAVVVMPSVRRPRWREQIGLPLVEGLAHGCRVVTTTETGLADDLREHPLVTLTTPGDARSLGDGLRAAMDAVDAGPAGAPGPERAGWSKRDVVGWWLSARSRGPAGR